MESLNALKIKMLVKLKSQSTPVETFMHVTELLDVRSQRFGSTIAANVQLALAANSIAYNIYKSSILFKTHFVIHNVQREKQEKKKKRKKKGQTIFRGRLRAAKAADFSRRLRLM